MSSRHITGLPAKTGKYSSTPYKNGSEEISNNFSDEEDSFELQKIDLHEQEGLLEENNNTRCTDRKKIAKLVLATVILGTIVFVQFLLLVGLHFADSSCPKTQILSTDFPSIRSSIDVGVKRRFTSGLHVDNNGTLSMAFDPEEPRYVGSPSPEIDSAWADLTDTRYIKLSDEEMSWLEQDTESDLTPFIKQKPLISEEGVYGGIDMLHSLHCLNGIRKHLDMDYYQDKMQNMPVKYRRPHMDHCLEQLRQSVLCFGDTTPVTLKPVWRDSTGRSHGVLGQTEYMHTCRNFDKLIDWMKERAKTKGAVHLRPGT